MKRGSVLGIFFAVFNGLLGWALLAVAAHNERPSAAIFGAVLVWQSHRTMDGVKAGEREAARWLP